MLARGVGHDPDPFALVRRTGIGRAQDTPPSIIPERGQVTEYTSEPSSNEVCGVFHERVLRSYLANDASKLAPKPRSFAVEASTGAIAADVLAGEPAANDVDGASPGLAVKRADIIPDGEWIEHTVPLASEQHAAAVGIKLDSADGAPAQQEPAQDAAACPCK
jgi:hypothetical protein